MPCMAISQLFCLLTTHSGLLSYATSSGLYQCRMSVFHTTSLPPSPMVTQSGKFSAQTKHGSNQTKEEVTDLIAIWGEIQIQRVFQSSQKTRLSCLETVTWGHDHDCTQYWSKCKVLRQQFASAWNINQKSCTSRVLCAHYKAQLLILTIKDTTHLWQVFGWPMPMRSV